MEPCKEFWQLLDLMDLQDSTWPEDLPIPPARAIMPDLENVQYRPGPSTSPTRPPIPFAENKTFLPQVRRFLVSFFGPRKDSRLLALPPELILLIATELPDASKASLALTCRTLFSIVLDSEPFRGLQFPPEQPLEFQSTRMSKPQIYQPARWEFLRFLEKDLNGKWYLCSECLTLHPWQMFAEYEKSTVPWLKDY